MKTAERVRDFGVILLGTENFEIGIERAAVPLHDIEFFLFRFGYERDGEHTALKVQGSDLHLGIERVLMALNLVMIDVVLQNEDHDGE